MSVVAPNGHLHLMGRRMAGIFEGCQRERAAARVGVVGVMVVCWKCRARGFLPFAM